MSAQRTVPPLRPLPPPSLGDSSLSSTPLSVGSIGSAALEAVRHPPGTSPKWVVPLGLADAGADGAAEGPPSRQPSPEASAASSVDIPSAAVVAATELRGPPPRPPTPSPGESQATFGGQEDSGCSGGSRDLSHDPVGEGRLFSGGRLDKAGIALAGSRHRPPPLKSALRRQPEAAVATASAPRFPSEGLGSTARSPEGSRPEAASDESPLSPSQGGVGPDRGPGGAGAATARPEGSPASDDDNPVLVTRFASLTRRSPPPKVGRLAEGAGALERAPWEPDLESPPPGSFDRVATVASTIRDPGPPAVPSASPFDVLAPAFDRPHDRLPRPGGTASGPASPSGAQRASLPRLTDGRRTVSWPDTSGGKLHEVVEYDHWRLPSVSRMPAPSKPPAPLPEPGPPAPKAAVASGGAGRGCCAVM